MGPGKFRRRPGIYRSGWCEYLSVAEDGVAISIAQFLCLALGRCA